MAAPLNIMTENYQNKKISITRTTLSVRKFTIIENGLIPPQSLLTMFVTKLYISVGVYRCEDFTKHYVLNARMTNLMLWNYENSKRYEM